MAQASGMLFWSHWFLLKHAYMHAFLKPPRGRRGIMLFWSQCLCHPRNRVCIELGVLTLPGQEIFPQYSKNYGIWEFEPIPKIWTAWFLGNRGAIWESWNTNIKGSLQNSRVPLCYMRPRAYTRAHVITPLKQHKICNFSKSRLHKCCSRSQATNSGWSRQNCSSGKVIYSCK
jgi:hypothetical protein